MSTHDDGYALVVADDVVDARRFVALVERVRDDMRKKVLTDELSAEEKALAEARKDYNSGAPTPLPEEQANAAKYQERIARLRQSVQLHERNIDALKKELGSR